MIVFCCLYKATIFEEFRSNMAYIHFKIWKNTIITFNFYVYLFKYIGARNFNISMHNASNVKKNLNFKGV